MSYVVDRDVIAPRDATDVVLVCVPEVLRLGLARLLSQVPGLAVRARAGLPREAEPTAVVALLCERGLGDLPVACAAAREQIADEVVVALEQPDVHLMLDCVAAGACAFVVEGDGTTELTAAVRAAAGGDHFVTPALLGLLLAMHRAQRTRAPDSDRELLRLLAGGRPIAEIAGALGVSPKTVRNRSSLLYRRLGVRSRAQAIAAAERRGLLD
jgi:DNA-binding NarL/FixJ family response regulator